MKEVFMKKQGTKNITKKQKIQIQELLNQGLSKKAIADKIGIAYRSIYRELQRGSVNGVYNAEYSCLRTEMLNKKKGQEVKLDIDKNLANYISQLILQEHMSIIQIKDRCKKEGKDCPSRTTIYNAIDKNLIPGVKRDNLLSNTTTMFSKGLVQIPKFIRERLNLHDKDMLEIEVTGNNIILRKKNNN